MAREYPTLFMLNVIDHDLSQPGLGISNETTLTPLLHRFPLYADSLGFQVLNRATPLSSHQQLPLVLYCITAWPSSASASRCLRSRPSSKRPRRCEGYATRRVPESDLRYRSCAWSQWSRVSGQIRKRRPRALQWSEWRVLRILLTLPTGASCMSELGKAYARGPSKSQLWGVDKKRATLGLPSVRLRSIRTPPCPCC